MFFKFNKCMSYNGDKAECKSRWSLVNKQVQYTIQNQNKAEQESNRSAKRDIQGNTKQRS